MADQPNPSGVKPGDTIEGRYRVIRAIDEGGMGSVFLAEHVLIKRRVAVKLLRGELAEDADVLERFMNEARAAGTLGHPNIVESTDMGFTRDGLPYIVFEYLEGTLLTDEIYRVHGFPVRRTLRIARQIASALGAAHTTGIVHRDLKADNVFLIDRDEAPDHVKVLDFGVSRFQDSESAPTPGHNLIIGTPQFMAPEQISAPESVDARADIYALGVIIYEMLTARRPFANDADPGDLFAQILTQPPPPLELKTLPRGFEDMLFEKFLAKQPADRFQSMKEVEAALETYANMVRPSLDSIPIARISDVSIPAQPEPAPVALPQAAAVVSLPAPPPRANHSWLVVGIVCLAGAVGLLMYRRNLPTMTAPNPAPLQADADRLGAAIDAAARAAELRADGFAQSPQLRAAAETDAATVKDMLKGDFVLNQAKGEIFELFQKKDGTVIPLLIRPDGPPLALPAEHQPRLHVDGKTLAVAVAAPVGPNAGVALSVPVDLTAVSAQLASHAQTVALRGPEAPLQLVAAATPGTVPIEAPVPVMRELGITLTLAATLSETPAEADPRLTTAQLGLWGAGGLFALLYAGSLIRARRRG